MVINGIKGKVVTSNWVLCTKFERFHFDQAEMNLEVFYVKDELLQHNIYLS